MTIPYAPYTNSYRWGNMVMQLESFAKYKIIVYSRWVIKNIGFKNAKTVCEILPLGHVVLFWDIWMEQIAKLKNFKPEPFWVGTTKTSK